MRVLTVNKFKIGDLVRSNYKSKKDCIWRIKDIETEKVPTTSIAAIQAAMAKNNFKLRPGSNATIVAQMLNVQPDGHDIEYTLVLERVFAPGTSKKRTIRVDPVCCAVVTKNEIKKMLTELQKNTATLNHLLAFAK